MPLFVVAGHHHITLVTILPKNFQTTKASFIKHIRAMLMLLLLRCIFLYSFVLRCFSRWLCKFPNIVFIHSATVRGDLWVVTVGVWLDIADGQNSLDGVDFVQTILIFNSHAPKRTNERNDGSWMVFGQQATRNGMWGRCVCSNVTQLGRWYGARRRNSISGFSCLRRSYMVMFCVKEVWCGLVGYVWSQVRKTNFVIPTRVDP